MDYIQHREGFRRNQRKKATLRHLRDRTNSMEDLNRKEFFVRFRLQKETVIRIVELIAATILLDPRGGGSIPPLLQVLICLRFYATNNFYTSIGDIIGISKQAVSTTVRRVSIALATHGRNLIQLESRPENLGKLRNKFFNIANFPGTIGAIDCTHIKILQPTEENSGRFYCIRKHMYSLNVQVVCDADMLITDIVARWPGSTHDSRIFKNSTVCNRLENGEFKEDHLLGDAGYACKAYLLTPYLNPTTIEEKRYNIAHSKTRCIIERLFGVWKRRFPCLQMGLRTQLETTMAIIVACAICHNIATEHGDYIDADEVVEENNDEDVGGIEKNDRYGRSKRDLITRYHFGQVCNNFLCSKA